MNCVKIYGIDRQPTDSKLKEDLIERFGSEKANILYNNVIWNDSIGDKGFLSYLSSKDNFLQDINGEPSIDEVLSWLENLKTYNRVSKTFTTNNFQSTTKEFIELSEGFTVYLTETLYEKGFTPNDLFQAKLLDLGTNDANIMNITLNKVIRNLKNNNDKRSDEIISALTDFKKEFYDSFNNYLEANLKFKIDTESILSDNIENKEDADTRDAAFNKSSFEFDSKDGAPKAIKMMISSLPEYQDDGTLKANSLGLPKTINYNNTFNYIQQKLVNIPGDINLMLSELENFENIIPSLRILRQRLNFGALKYTPTVNNSKQYAREQLLRTQFVNQFDKSKNEFTLHIKNEDGTISLIDSNIDKIENIVLKQWENNFKDRLSNNSNLFADIQKVRAKGKKEFLNFLGIEVEDLDNIPNEIVDDIYEYGVRNEENFSNLYTPKKGEGVKSKLRQLATRVAIYSDNVVDFQHFNAENKLVYGITLNTYLSSLAKELRYYAGTEKLYEKFPELFEDGYNTNSIWLEKILDGEKINVGIFDGFKSSIVSSNSKASKNLKARDLNIQRLIGILQEGKYPFLRSADRSTENYFYFENNKDLLVNSIDEAKSYLLNHLKDELSALNDNSDIVHYKKNNTDFRVFYITENGKKISLLEKFDKDKSKALEIINEISNLDTNEVISKFIDDMINEIIEKERSHLSSNGILNTKNNEYIYIDSLVKQYDNIDNVVTLFALNSHVSNIEQSKTFIGDLAYFKNPSDIFKRMSMLNSTKETARIDEEINNYLDSLTHEFEEAQGYTREVKDSKIKTVTLEDVVSNASQFNKEFDSLLKEVFGKDYKRYSSEYNAMNEADGFAYMTYDEYRIASNRFGEWLPQDEKLYQKLVNGDTSVASEIIRRATIKKYQYTGKLLNNENKNVISGRKFSIMPLIPSVLPKNSILEKLNNDMLSNGIGMAFYESAAKFGYSTFKNENNKEGAHILYDSNRDYQLDLADNYDILDYKYLGNQLKIHNDPKEKITASTQKRKLVKSNLYENGEVISEEIKTLLDTYDKVQSKIVKDAFTKTIANYNEEGITNTEESLNALVEALIDQGLSQGYSTNELQSLEFLKEVPIFDILPNKQRIENLLMAKLRNNTISNKRKGDALAQVPDVGFEIDSKIEAEAEKHNLKFYRKSESGKLLPMEIMIPLPEEMIGYIRDIYGNGEFNDSVLEEFNNAIAEDTIEFEKTGVPSNLGKMITYIGFRIPNQAASSSDVARVKKFLPPYQGGTVVVPKPIVAKTGSDFDIDKLNLYKPHIKFRYENESKIASNFLKEKDVNNNSLRTWLKKEYPTLSFENNVKKDFINLILLQPEGILSHPVMIEVNKSFKKYLKQNKTKIVSAKYISSEANIEDLSGSELGNKLLETEIAITLAPENWKQLLAPLTATIIQDIVQDIRNLRGENSNQDHISDVFTNSKNIEKFIAFLSGKGGVGQVAVHITNHVLAQQANLQMKPLHNYFGFKDNIQLGTINNESGQNISEILSELLTSYVDIAKDPYILDLNALQQTANTILMMLRWGMNPKTVFYFMNQPIVREFTKRQSLNESVVNDKNTGKLSKANLVQSVLQDFNINVKNEDLIYHTETEIENGDTQVVRKGKIYDDFTIEELRDGIKKGDNANKDLQLKSLDLFLEYQRQSKIFQKMIRSTSPDTQRFKNITSLETQLKERGEVIESDMFVNYSKMFDNFIGDYFNVKVDYFNIMKDLFLSQNSKYKTELDGLKELALSKTFGENEKIAVIDRIENEFIRYIIGRTGIVNYVKGFNNLFTGGNSIPKILRAIKKEFKEYDYSNSFIEDILPLINETGEGFDNMKLKTKKLSISQKEVMTSDFKEFADYDNWIEEEFGLKNFYKSLIAYQIIQSGINNSPYSYIDIIPSEDYVNLIKEGIQQAINGNIPIEDYTGTTSELPGEFLLNNPQIWYNKFGLPFRIERDNLTGKFLVILNDYSVEQLGKGVRYGIYNAYPSFRTVSQKAKEENAYVRDVFKPNNELNCSNNK